MLLALTLVFRTGLRSGRLQSSLSEPREEDHFLLRSLIGPHMPALIIRGYKVNDLGQPHRTLRRDSPLSYEFGLYGAQQKSYVFGGRDRTSTYYCEEANDWSTTYSI